MTAPGSPDALARIRRALAERYDVERPLGAGGMATVYLCRDLKHDRRVALKVLHPDLAAVLGAERFLQEIRLAANLQHAHILPLFDSGEADGLLYYVMPYVEGETLRDRLARERQLPVADAVRIASEVAAALDYAHRAGVVHRDIKPENILLRDGQAVIADFGIALAVKHAGGTRMTETGLSLGTPFYMSPEQASADRTLDGRTDLFALGAVLHEMLAGEPPHTGASAQAIVLKLMTEPPTPLRTLRPTVPEHVEAAVLVALAKLPGDRFGTASEFARALADPSAAPRSPASTGSRAANMAGRRRRWGAGALVAAGIVVLAWSATSAARRPEGPAVAFKLTPPVTEGTIGSSYGVARLAPDGSAVVMQAVGPNGLQLFVRRLDMVDATPVAGSQGAWTGALSPDGSRIAFTDVAGRLIVASADGSASRVLSPDVGWSPSGVVWIDDATLLVGGVAAPGDRAGRRGLARVTVADGAVRHLPRTGTPAGSSDALPVLLDDQRTVAFIEWGPGFAEDDFIGLLDPTSGRMQVSSLAAYDVIGSVGDFLLYVGLNGRLMRVPFDRKTLTLRPDQARPVDDPRLRDLRGGSLARDGTLLALQGDPHERIVVGDQPRPVGPRLGFGVMPGAGTVPRLSPDGRRVALSVMSSAGLDHPSNDIWLMDLATGDAKRLSSLGNVDSPVWSADGQSVLFRTWYSGRQAIWRQPADGSAPATAIVTAPAGRMLGIAESRPDGLLYCAGTGGMEIGQDTVYLQPPGAAAPRVVGLVGGARYCNARRSADGRWIATNRPDPDGAIEGGSVLVAPVDAPDRLFRVSDVPSFRPTWGRDGLTLFFTEIDRVGQEGRVVAVRLASEGGALRIVDRRVLASLGRFGTEYDVAPDGRTVIRPEALATASEWVVLTRWREQLRSQLR